MPKKQLLLTLCTLLLSANLLAQGHMHKREQVNYKQMTHIMTKQLQLNDKQQKKVAKLNKKYKTLIEGEQQQGPQSGRPPMGERPNGGGHGGGMPGGGFGGGMPGGGFGGGMPGGMGGHGGGFGGGMPGGGHGGNFGGGGMPGGMGRGGMSGAPTTEESYDYDKKQKKYDKAIAKLLTPQQLEGYQKIKSQFASQRRVKDFLMGGQQGMTPGNLPPTPPKESTEE